MGVNYFSNLRAKLIRDAKPPHPDSVYYCSNLDCPNKGKKLPKPPDRIIGKMSVCGDCKDWKPVIEKGSGRIYKRRPFKTFLVKGFK